MVFMYDWNLGGCSGAMISAQHVLTAAVSALCCGGVGRARRRGSRGLMLWVLVRVRFCYTSSMTCVCLCWSCMEMRPTRQGSYSSTYVLPCWPLPRVILVRVNSLLNWLVWGL